MIGKPIWMSILLTVIFSGIHVYGDVNVLDNPGFESGTTGWEAHGGSISTVTSPVHSGSRSGRSYNRTATWQGIHQNIKDKIVIGETYQMSGWVRLENTSSANVKISVKKTDDNDTSYSNVDTATANNSSWVYLSGNYNVNVSGTLTELLVYFEGPASGVSFFVDDVSVYGPEPGPTDPDATGQVNVNTRYQEIEGFGAAGGWYEGWLTAHPQKNTLYNILFGQLGLDIYRIRNVYDQGSNDYMTRSAEIITAGEASLGRPLKIMISCWSPPTYLKSNGSLNGGTLKKDASENYMYDELADWWADSLDAWSSTYGVDADYINLQNEPDFVTTWDTCEYAGTETTSLAGYDQAFEAVWQEVNSRMGASMPRMLAAEAAGIPNSAQYLDNLINYSHVYGYAHHLYNINSGDNPDVYISAMSDFANDYGDRPLFQTEYEASTGSWPDAMNLALLLHNSLTVEEVSGYLYWDLFWGGSGGLVTLPSYGSSDYTINSDYYGFKQYCAFIHSGWERVYATNDNPELRMSAYISPNDYELTVILINTSTDTAIAADLSYTGFTIVSGEVYRTSETENCVNAGSYTGSSPVSVPAYSIVTLSLSAGTPDTTPPANPTGLTATAGEVDVSLDWNNNSEPDLDGYNVYRSTTSGSGYIQLNGPLLSSSDYIDTNVLNGVTYYYVVTAVDNSTNESGYSNEDDATPVNSTPPAAPTGLTASDIIGSISLDWNDNSESDLDGYNVFRSTTSGSGYSQINVSLVSSSDYIDHTVSNDITYYYVVTAVDIASNESGYSNEDSAMTYIPLNFATFESGFGEWVNVTGEDSHDWTRNSGSTPSSDTGPDSGVYDSTWYVYLETSGAGGGAYYAGDTAILEGPEIPDAPARGLSFYYHMYGADTGTLYVDVYHEGSWHNGIWSISGQQHTSSSDEYTQAIVGLKYYPGTIRIRLRVVAAGGYLGDMAIDNIVVDENLAPPLYGDFNEDLIVNIEDLVTFMGYWFVTDCGELDLNGDCVINLEEFKTFARNWLL
ncbi:MAG: carbohydrate binding domain-containing protein [Sedimentisphaerales bacterium]|nr:carbohydrate binding domain-containing protein [Sedimentisphaerales bacterium]